MSMEWYIRVFNVTINVLVIILSASGRRCPTSEKCKLKNLHKLDKNESPYYDAPERMEPDWETPTNGNVLNIALYLPVLIATHGVV